MEFWISDPGNARGDGIGRIRSTTNRRNRRSGGTRRCYLHATKRSVRREFQSRKTAYPGAINYIEGYATLNGEPLAPSAVGSAVVGPNQIIATTGGYAEVLLTPG